MDLELFFLTLNESAGSIFLRESLHAYSWIETLHVAALAVFLGLVLAFDLRLLGVGYRELPVIGMLRAILPWSLCGFLVVMSTGLLLFYANPLRLFHSVWFRLKILLLLASILNVIFFHRCFSRDGAHRGAGPPLPLPARLAGGVSIICWVAVIVMGRLIAFDWFDCDHAPPPWAAWLAGCLPFSR